MIALISCEASRKTEASSEGLYKNFYLRNEIRGLLVAPDKVIKFYRENCFHKRLSFGAEFCLFYVHHKTVGKKKFKKYHSIVHLCIFAAGFILRFFSTKYCPLPLRVNT